MSMLTETRIKIYLNAYNTRLNKGESMDDIDKSFKDMNRLNDKELAMIHEKLEKNK